MGTPDDVEQILLDAAVYRLFMRNKSFVRRHAELEEPIDRQSVFSVFYSAMDDA